MYKKKAKNREKKRKSTHKTYLERFSRKKRWFDIQNLMALSIILCVVIVTAVDLDLIKPIGSIDYGYYNKLETLNWTTKSNNTCKYEYPAIAPYIPANYSGGINIFQSDSNSWAVQGFNLSQSGYVDKVNLSLKRASGYPDICNVWIYDGYPNVTTNILTYGNFNGSTIELAWKNITVDMTNVQLNNRRPYYLGFNCSNATYEIDWMIDMTGTYGGGHLVYTNNNGTTWANESAQDTNFVIIMDTNENLVNQTVTCSDNTTTFSLKNQKNLTFYVEDTGGVTNSSLIKWHYKLYSENETYNANATEGTVEYFALNFTLNNTRQLSSINLVYNNTVNTAIFTKTGNSYFINKSLNIPSVTADTLVNFFWNVTLTDSTIIYTINKSQNIGNLEIDDCTANSVLILNYTLKDEQLQNVINGSFYNTLIKVDVDIYTKSDRNSPIIEFSQNFSNYNNTKVCLENTLSNEVYEMDVQVFYDGDSYAPEYHNIQNYTLMNSTAPIHISLFDLLDSYAQEFKITFKDENFLAVKDALIQIQRKYVDEGVFKTVEQPKTDASGSTVAQLQTGSTIYTLVVVKNGVTLGTFDNIIPVCQNPALETCEINLNSFASSVSPKDYTIGDDFIFTLSYTPGTRTIGSIWSIPSGAPSTVLMNATLFDNLGTTQACADSLTSSSGTLSCAVPISLGNGTVYVSLKKDDVVVGNAFIDMSKEPEDLYGANLVFLGLFLILTLLGVGVIDNPIITGIFIFIGAILLITLNLVDTGVSSFIGAGATVLWLAIAIILVLIKGAKRQ